METLLGSVYVSLGYWVLVLCNGALSGFVRNIQGWTLAIGRELARLCEASGYSESGFQDPLTPRWHTRASALCLALGLGILVGGFLISWKVAVGAVVLQVLVGRIVQRTRRRDPEYYVALLLGDLMLRRQRFEHCGDHVRVKAASWFIDKINCYLEDICNALRDRQC
jgi:hypothetical protein